MKITIEIETGNAAFEDNGIMDEIEKIFSDILQNWHVINRPYSCSLQDSNGNTIGKVEVSE